MADYSVKVLGGGRIQLSYVEVVAALDAAGWPEAEWGTAAAVIAAESDRVCNIYNTYKSGHYGLMQMSASAHAAWFKSLPTNGWVNPIANCAGGLTLWKQSKYQPWEAYTNGRYAAYKLQAAAAVSSYKSKKAAAGNPSGEVMAAKVTRQSVKEGIEKLRGGSTGPVSAIVDAIAGVADTATGAVDMAGDLADAVRGASTGIVSGAQLMVGASKWLSDSANWLRIAQVAAGGALLVVGMSIVAKPLLTGAAGKAVSALPTAKVAKGVKKVTKAVDASRTAGKKAAADTAKKQAQHHATHSAAVAKAAKKAAPKKTASATEAS